jgi:hypothetical protein
MKILGYVRLYFYKKGTFMYKVGGKKKKNKKKNNYISSSKGAT